MKVIGNVEGGFGTLSCDNCNGKTGYLHIVEKEGKTFKICTSCRSIANLIAEGKGDAITRIWQSKSGKEFENKI